MRIICDMDAILADTLKNWLALYNREWNDSITKDDILHWDVHKSVKPECGVDVYKYIEQPDFFIDLEPLPGAIEGFRQLQNAGHEMLICSSPSPSPMSAAEKLAWLHRHLPEFPRKYVMLGHQKHWLKADILIDDSAATAETYLKEWPEAACLTVAYHYNMRFYHERYHRFNGHNSTALAWSSIVRMVGILDRRKYEKDHGIVTLEEQGD